MAVRVLGRALSGWRRHNAAHLAAALAFYSLLSAAPLLMLVVLIVGSVWEGQGAESTVFDGLKVVIGDPGAETVRGLIERAEQVGSKWRTTALSIFFVVFGATRIFTELQSALDVVWRDRPPASAREHLLATLRRRAFAFAMVIGVGALCVAGILSSTAIAAVSAWMQDSLPAGFRLARLVQPIVSFLVTVLSVVLLYHLLPRVKVRWAAAWLGGSVAAVGLHVAQRLLAAFLGGGLIRSLYGATASVIVVLIWFYASWLIFLFGAELARAWQEREGAT